jgi:AcrR family transcriptional regulator
MLAALLGYVTEHPAATQLLGNESLAAGEDAAQAHDALLQTLGATFTSSDPKATCYLVAPDVLLGGVLRMLQPHLQAGETAVDRFLDDTAAWMSHYELAPDAVKLQPTALAHTPAPRFLPEPPLLAPKPLSPGRSVLPQGEVNRNRRERILYATAQAVTERGYLEVTVDDIVARAQIARRAFYQHFEDTDAAFLATLEFFSQPLLATTAGAFFSTRQWPARILAALQALLNFLSHYPAVAHAFLIDSPAAGQAAARSIHATERALMLLLEEGFNESTDEPPPRLAAELTIATVLGLANQRLRTEPADQLPGHLPEFAAVVLAPFLGADVAGNFIHTQL